MLRADSQSAPATWWTSALPWFGALRADANSAITYRLAVLGHLKFLRHPNARFGAYEVAYKRLRFGLSLAHM